MDFSRQEYRSGLPFPSPKDLPGSGIEPPSPALAGRFFTTKPPGKSYSAYNSLHLLIPHSQLYPSLTIPIPWNYKSFYIIVFLTLRCEYLFPFLSLHCTVGSLKSETTRCPIEQVPNKYSSNKMEDGRAGGSCRVAWARLLREGPWLFFLVSQLELDTQLPWRDFWTLSYIKEISGTISK